MSICNLVISHFGFEGKTLVLIAPVPGHCFSFYLSSFPFNVLEAFMLL